MHGRRGETVSFCEHHSWTVTAFVICPKEAPHRRRVGAASWTVFDQRPHLLYTTATNHLRRHREVATFQMSQNIFSDEEVSIFEHINDFHHVFSGFETFMRGGGNEKILNDLNDRNIDVLLKASKATGDDRRCILLQHAVKLHEECRARE